MNRSASRPWSRAYPGTAATITSTARTSVTARERGISASITPAIGTPRMKNRPCRCVNASHTTDSPTNIPISKNAAVLIFLRK